MYARREREVQSSADGSLTEAVFPVDCGVEAVPGLWTTGAAEGFVLLAAEELDHTLEPGDVVAEVRSGLVETAACDCGAVETNFLWVGEEGPCETCCFSCGSVERTAVRSYQVQFVRQDPRTASASGFSASWPLCPPWLVRAPRGNENTILGMGLHGTLSTRKGTPRYVRNRLQGKPVPSHVFNVPRAGQTWFPKGTRPAPSERAFGAFQTTRSPGFRSTVRLCLLASLALAAELLSQCALTAALNSANCWNWPRAQSETGSNSRAARSTSLSQEGGAVPGMPMAACPMPSPAS